MTDSPPRPWVSLIDNNSWQVGVAELDAAHPTKIRVSQITDARSHFTTLEHLDSVEPVLLLVPHSYADRALVLELKKRFGEDKVKLINRSWFNETRGEEVLRELSGSKLQARDLHAQYLGRAAACALVTYFESVGGGGGEDKSEGTVTLKRAVVELDPWIAAGGRLKMDFATIRGLELVANRRNGGKEGSLLSVMNLTSTPMGSRLLRGQIISPPAVLQSVQDRLDAVEEMLSKLDTDEDGAERARNALKRMPDLDRVVSRFNRVPKNFTIRELKAEIDAVIDLRSFLLEVGIFNDTLAPYDAAIWQTAKNTILEQKGMLGKMRECIDSIVATRPVGQVKSGRSGGGVGGASVNHHLQDLFCVKADVDGMLDTARLAYVQVVHDMEEYVARLISNTGLTKLELKRTNERGYHLIVPRSFEKRLTSDFVQGVRTQKAICCTTRELASMNTRQSKLENEILLLTVARLQQARAVIAQELEAFLKISETVAMCDMLVGFALLSQQEGYRRPKINDKPKTIMSLKQVRHPVLETLILNSEYHPRDIFMNTKQQLLVVTGENCIGKTTLLTTMALISIQAQLGCFVPCDLCEIPLISRICTRLATDDALEQNASTFSLEMEETAFLLDSVEKLPQDKTCLVLIDELGRGTSSRDGLAVAAAVCETLLQSPVARVFFVTHFFALCELVKVFPEKVTSLTLTPNEDGSSGSHVNGQDDLDGGYGIRLAVRCDMPKEIVDQAIAFRGILAKHATNVPSEGELGVSGATATGAIVTAGVSPLGTEANSENPTESLFAVLNRIEATSKKRCAHVEDSGKVNITEEWDFKQGEKLLKEFAKTMQQQGNDNGGGSASGVIT